MSSDYRLVLSCEDRPGIVAAVAGVIANCGGTIVEANHYTDSQNARFYMRNEIQAAAPAFSLSRFRAELEPIARQFSMARFVSDSSARKRVVLFASKESHCLVDLLHRWHEDDLPAEIIGVVSNHQDLRGIVEWYGVPFRYIDMAPNTKLDAFMEIERQLNEWEPDVLVLARFMQILPPEMCHEYAGKVINIHHSFLPSFIGARPYHQAYERGVKLIGATCHYVTAELDAGPIIEQDVIRVTHSQGVEELRRLGRDVEKMVLSRGLRFHLEDRVIVDGNKTVVFSG